MRWLLLIIAISIGFTSYAERYEFIGKDSIIQNGVQQLNYLYAYNNKNNKKNKQNKNWYIFYIGGNVGELKDSIAYHLHSSESNYIIDLRASQKIYTATFVAQLNTLLQSINSQPDIEYYVALTSHDEPLILQLTPQGEHLEDQINYYKLLLKEATSSIAEVEEIKKNKKDIEVLREWYIDAVNTIFNSSQISTSTKPNKFLSVGCEYKRVIDGQSSQLRQITSTRKVTPLTISLKAFNNIYDKIESSLTTTNDLEKGLERIVKSWNAYIHTDIDKFKYDFGYSEVLPADHPLMELSKNSTPPAQLPDPVSAPIYLFDYTGMYSDPATYNELNSLLAGQKLFQDPDADPTTPMVFWDTKVRMYVTNEKTPENIKERINGYSPGYDLIMVWVNYSKEGVSMSVKFGPGLEKRYTDRFTWDNSGFLGKSWLVIKNTGQTVGTAVISTFYFAFDFLGHIIRKKATIPRCYWDPENPKEKGGYNPLMANIVKTVILGGLNFIDFSEIMKDWGIPLVPAGNQLITVPVAFMCGLWNGIVDEVAGVFEGGAMLTGALVDEDKAAELQFLWRKVKESGLGKILGDQIEKTHTGTPHQLVYQFARDIVFVAAIAVPFVGAATRVKAGLAIVKIGDFVNLLNKFDPLNYVFQAGGWILKKTTVLGKMVACEVIKQGLKSGAIAYLFVEVADNASKLVTVLQVSSNYIVTGVNQTAQVVREIFPALGFEIREMWNNALATLGPKDYMRLIKENTEHLFQRGSVAADTFEELLQKAINKTDDAVKAYLTAAEAELFKAELRNILETNGREIYNLDERIVRSWLWLKDWTKLRKNATYLLDAAKLMENPKLASSGVNLDFLKELLLASQANGGKAAIELGLFLKGMDQLVTRGTIFENMERVLSDIEKGYNWAQGASFVIQGICSDIEEFAGKRLRFEINSEVVDMIDPESVLRRIDVQVIKESGKTRTYFFYEFKSVKDLPPHDFAKQFLSDLNMKDLAKLQDLRWIFDSRKGITTLDKQVFIDAIKSDPLAFARLENPVVKTLFEEFEESLGRKNVVFVDAQSLITYFETHNEWFETIFRVY